MKPVEPGDEELRDDTLRRALAQAPDRAQLPDWRVRQAILEHARDAVAALEELQAASREPTPWWRLGWWRDKVGTPGRSMPWNAAFATLAVAVLVTVLWQREPVPGARLDERPVPAAPAPVPTDALRGDATVRGGVQEAEEKKKERGEDASREALPAPTPQEGPLPAPPPTASAPPPVAPTPPAPTPAQAPAPPASVAPAAPTAPATAPGAAVAPARRAPSAEARSTRPAEQEQAASPPALADAAPAPRAASPEASAKSAARDQASRQAEAPTPVAPAPAAAPVPSPAAEALSRQRAAGASSLAAAPAEAGGAGAARGKAAASDVRTDATPLPSFASLGQWTQLRLANVSGEVRIVPRAEAGELSQLLSSAAIMAVGAQPMRALSEWRVSLERRGDVLAVLEVGRNQVRWTEGALPPATGTPPVEALDALRLSLRNAMKPGAPGRPLEPAPLPRPSPQRAPEVTPPAASAVPSTPTPTPVPVAPSAAPVVPATPPSPPAIAVPVPPPAPLAPEPAAPLMPPLEPAAPRNGESAPPS